LVINHIPKFVGPKYMYSYLHHGLERQARVYNSVAV